MKKLALIIMMFSVSCVVLSGEEYTIQTISAQKASSITPAFEKKVHKSALVFVKKKEGECNIVTVGKYHTTKEARHDLNKAKAISKDAFVRRVERTTPKVCISKSETHTSAMKDVNSSAKVKAVATAHSAPVMTMAEISCKDQPCEKISNNVYLYDRNLGRKSDIHDAIEFYKNSQYHSFHPVALQSSN